MTAKNEEEINKTPAAEPSKPDRSNHHWSEADICLLIERAYHGECWAKIAERLDRSAHACEQEHSAIISGKTLPFDLPPKTQELLYAHRKILNPHASPFEPDLRRLLTRIYQLRLGSIALQIKNKVVTPQEIAVLVDQDEIDQIAAMVAEMEGGKNSSQDSVVSGQ